MMSSHCTTLYGAVLAIADGMETRSLSFENALGELARILHRVALAQAAPDAVPEDTPERERILALARALDPEDVQLYYQIAVQGRQDLLAYPKFERITPMLTEDDPVLAAERERPRVVDIDNLTALHLALGEVTDEEAGLAPSPSAADSASTGAAAASMATWNDTNADVVRGIHKGFGKTPVITGVDLAIRRGERHARAKRNQCRQRQTPYAHHDSGAFCNSRTSGMIFFSSASAVSGPICLKRMVPPLSITNVSGTP